MKSSLISKLEKLALIPIAAFCLSNTSLNAQDKDSIRNVIAHNKTIQDSIARHDSIDEMTRYLNEWIESYPNNGYRNCGKYRNAMWNIHHPKKNLVVPSQSFNNSKMTFGWDFDFNFRLGVGEGPKMSEPYKDYNNNFQPEGGSGKIDETDFFFTEFLNAGVSYKIRTESFAIGPRLGFTTSNLFGRNRSLSSLTIDWWDPVKLQDIALKKTPNLGISMDFISDYNVNVTFSAYQFKLYERHFKGDDCYGCKNSSHPFESIPLDKGIGTKLSVTFYGEGDMGYYGWGFFFETNGTSLLNGKYSTAIGASYNIMIRTNE